MPLATGETLPARPAYWLIWILNEKGKPYHSRGAWDKCMTPAEASKQAYGMTPTENMRFYNLGTNLVEARKRLRQIERTWPKEAV